MALISASTRLLDVSEFGADGDAVLMRRVARQTELLRVIRFELDSHNVVVLSLALRLLCRNEKPPAVTRQPGAGPTPPGGRIICCSRCYTTNRYGNQTVGRSHVRSRVEDRRQTRVPGFLSRLRKTVARGAQKTCCSGPE